MRGSRLLGSIKTLALAFVLLQLYSCSGGGGGSAGGSAESSSTSCSNPANQKNYLMAFHACDTALKSCSNPTNHTIYLAGSDDGVNFSLVDSFTPRAGSVPDVLFHEGALYIFHTGGSERWVKLDSCMNPVATGSLSIDGVADSFVDPSTLSLDGQIIMFYLPGVIGADPAGCSAYPCSKEIRSASATGTDPSSMASVSGARAAMTLANGTFSDPDIVPRSDGGYLLYVSSGQSVYVFTGSNVNATFTPPGGGSPYYLVQNAGGVPAGIESDDGNVWIYVTTNNAGVEIIRRAVSSDGVTPLSSGAFSTVISAGSIPSFTSTTSVSSPSITKWKGLQG